LLYAFRRELREGWGSDAWLGRKKKLDEWRGGLSVFANGMCNKKEPSHPFFELERLQQAWLRASYVLRKVRFLCPGKKEAFPLMQEIWRKPPRGESVTKHTDMATDSTVLTATADPILAVLDLEFDLLPSPTFVEFASPFEAFFTAGWLCFNLQHPVASALADCIHAVRSRISTGTLDADASRPLKNVFGKMGSLSRSSDDYLDGAELEIGLEAVKHLFELAEKFGIFALSHKPSWGGRMVNIPRTISSGRVGEPIRELKEVGIYTTSASLRRRGAESI
jgi:hypothetical protein